MESSLKVSFSKISKNCSTCNKSSTTPNSPLPFEKNYHFRFDLSWSAHYFINSEDFGFSLKSKRNVFCVLVVVGWSWMYDVMEWLNIRYIGFSNKERQGRITRYCAAKNNYPVSTEETFLFHVSTLLIVVCESWANGWMEHCWNTHPSPWCMSIYIVRRSIFILISRGTIYF